MSTYAFLNSDGFVQSFVESECEQESGVLIEHEIGFPPELGFSYHLATKTWCDTRSVKSKSEAASRAVKTQRAKLLSSSDWSQLPDISQVVRTAWVPYRKALRDITLQAGYPFNVDWPTAP